MRAIAAALAVFFVVAACGGRIDDSGTLRACPPAPYRADGPEGPLSCAFEDTCRYPTRVQSDDSAYCNVLECTCDAGALMCKLHASWCRESPAPRCPDDAIDGASCGARFAGQRNHECLREKDDSVCACDIPGPSWRCVPHAL